MVSLEVEPLGRDGVDGAAPVQLAGDDEVGSRSVVDREHSRHDAFPHQGAAQDAAPFVVHLDYVRRS